MPSVRIVCPVDTVDAVAEIVGPRYIEHTGYVMDGAKVTVLYDRKVPTLKINRQREAIEAEGGLIFIGGASIEGLTKADAAPFAETDEEE